AHGALGPRDRRVLRDEGPPTGERSMGVPARAALRLEVRGAAHEHPARPRIRPFLRRALPPGPGVASVLHPAAPPVAVRHDGRGHRDARPHPLARRAPRHRRRGPARGLVVAVPVLVYGLMTSPVTVPPEGTWQEGQSLLYLLLKRIILGP